MQRFPYHRRRLLDEINANVCTLIANYLKRVIFEINPKQQQQQQLA